MNMLGKSQADSIRSLWAFLASFIFNMLAKKWKIPTIWKVGASQQHKSRARNRFFIKNLEIDYFPDSNCHKHFVQLMQNDFCLFTEEKYILNFFKEKDGPYMLFRLQCLFLNQTCGP